MRHAGVTNGCASFQTSEKVRLDSGYTHRALCGLYPTNTGPVAGDEIVQLYVGYECSRVDRPLRNLKAFTRVHLDPAETKRVALPLQASDLPLYDVDANSWEVERITYSVQVGPSSRELPLQASFAVSD